MINITIFRIIKFFFKNKLVQKKSAFIITFQIEAYDVK